MPFGLADALTTSLSFISKCLVEELDIFCIMYLDDIIIYTSKKAVKNEKAIK